MAVPNGLIFLVVLVPMLCTCICCSCGCSNIDFLECQYSSLRNYTERRVYPLPLGKSPIINPLDIHIIACVRIDVIRAVYEKVILMYNKMIVLVPHPYNLMWL